MAVVALATVAGIAGVAIVGTRLAAAQSSLDRVTALDRATGNLTESLLDEETGFRGYELTGSQTFLAPYDKGLADAQAAEAAFRSAAGGDPALLARLDDVTSAATAWRQNWVNKVIALVAAGNLDEVRRQVETGQGETLFNTVRTRLDTLAAAIDGPSQAVHADVQAVGQLVLLMGATAIVTTVLILLAIAGYMVIVVLRPLGELARTSRRLEQGRPAAFQAPRDDEIGTLAGALERLHLELEGRYETAALQAARATALNELSESLNLAPDEPGLLAAGVSTIRRVVPVDGGEILLLNPAGDGLVRRFAWRGDGPAGAEAFGDEPGRVGASGDGVQVFPATACPVVRNGRTLATRGGHSPSGLRCEAHPFEGLTHACVPLDAMGRRLGIIHLYRSDQNRDFDSPDLELAAQVGTQVGLVLANRRLLADLEQMAMTDSLTGVKNARFFDAYLERELSAARRDRRPLGLIMLDVDHFKEFNDAHGHPAGDEALRTLTRTVEATIRTSDTLARYGGEEFVVCVRAADLDETIRVAEKMRHAIEASPVVLADGQAVPMSASFGVANTALHGADRHTLVLRADQALYLAKQRGRNRVELPPSVEPESTARAVAKAPGAGPTGTGAIGPDTGA